MSRAESSRRRYRTFVKAYRDRTLEDPADGEKKPKAGWHPRGQGQGSRQAARISARLHQLAVAAPLCDCRLLPARPDHRRPRDDRAALHAVHHRPRPAQRDARPRRAPVAAAPRRRLLRRRHRRRQHDAGDQGLPPEAAQRQRDAVAAAVAVRSHAAPAAGEALRHEDRRHPVAADRRRRNDQRPAADGGRLAVALGDPPGDRRVGPDGAQLAPGPDRDGDHSRHHGDEPGIHAAHPADLPVGAQGRRDHRRPRRRDLLRHPRRARLRARDARARRVHARPPHRAAQGAVRASPRAAGLDVLGPADLGGQRRHRLVRRLS